MDVISDKADVLRILPEAEAELCSALFRNSPSGIYITRDGKFIYTNIEFRRITGYNQEELSGKDYQRLINPRYRQQPKQNIASLFEEDETIGHEFKITTKEGKKKWISEKITYFKYGGNWLTLGHWLDISDHHSVEKAWREAERRFQSAFEDLTLGLAIISTDGIFLKVNKAFCDMLGYEEKDILESRFDQLLHPDERETCCDIMALFLSLEKPEQAEKRCLQAADGRTVWSAMSISLIGDSEGGPTYFIVHFQDITEQKRIEEGIKEEERLYRSIIDLSLEPVAVTSLEGHITHVSQKFITMLGYDSQSDLIGRTTASLVREDEREKVQSRIIEILTGGASGMFPATFISRDGTELPAELHISWINNDKGAPAFIVISPREINEAIPAAREAVPAQQPAPASQPEPVEPEIAEPAAQASASLLETLEQTSTAFILISADTTIACVNSAFEKMSGYPRGEIEGKKKWIEFVAPQDQPRLKKYHLLRRIDPASAPNTFEFKFTDCDGAVKDMLFNITPVPGTDRQIATFLEVAECKQALQDTQLSQETEKNIPEQAAVQSVDRYQKYLEAMPESVIVTDSEGVITYASPRAIKCLASGIVTDIVGKSYRQFIRPGLVENANQAFKTLLDTGDLKGGEVELVRTDGQIELVEVDPGMCRDRSGEPAGAVFVFKDIARHKLVEQAKEETDMYYRLLAEHITDVVWMMDMGLKVTWLSPSSPKIRGFSLEEIYALPLDRQLTPESIEKAMIMFEEQTAMEREGNSVPDRTVSMELEFYCKDGSTRCLDCRFQFIRDERGKTTGILAEGRDISERKRVEKTLEHSLITLEKTVEGAIQAISTVIELRDPYTSGHQERVARMAGAISRQMGLPDDLVKGVEITGRIHDIGKIYVPMEILSKPGALSQIERQIIQTHARGSYNILKSIDFPWPVAEIALQHHERLDGSGYPQGLKENEIMLEAKILMVADVVEAMSSYRPYRASCGIEAALAEISGNSGILYDSNVVTACLKLFREEGFSLEEQEHSA